ncbi:hypothetical protein FQR65_LT05263 [Abscondita terminalis]|nr:hypothetical protein FQR65_LT05263 [Abscondita terminalis]
MDSLRRLCPDMEVYSIDEAFLKLDHFSYYDLNTYLIDIRQKIKQWTGIPISIGLASSKTLAKVANFYAKRVIKTGVCDLRSAPHRDSLLKTLPIEEIWGIGRKLAEKLHHYSIKTAFDLQQANPKIMRRCFSVVVERIILELNGISCLGLESVAAKKQIMCSRSFGRPITHLHDLSSALSRYTARAASKLREQDSKTQVIYVFITTNKHKASDRQYMKGLACSLVAATDDTRVLITAAQQVLKQLYKSGFNYKKAGILLMDIIPRHQQPNDLFIQSTLQYSSALMKIVDEVNKIFGAHTLFFAAEETGKAADWISVLTEYNKIPALRGNTSPTEMLGRSRSVRDKFAERGFPDLQVRQFEPRELLSLVILCYSNPTLIGHNLCTALNDDNTANVKKEMIQFSAYRTSENRVLPSQSNLRLLSTGLYFNDTNIRLPQSVIDRVTRETIRDERIVTKWDERGGFTEVIDGPTRARNAEIAPRKRRDVSRIDNYHIWRSLKAESGIVGEEHTSAELAMPASTSQIGYSGNESELVTALPLHAKNNVASSINNENLAIVGLVGFHIFRNLPVVSPVMSNIGKDLKKAGQYVGNLFSRAESEQQEKTTLLSPTARS